jgi:hypothetical protein
MAKKQTRRSRTHAKKHRGHSRKHHSRRQRGGNSTPGSVNGDMMKPMMNQSLAQGNQFANMHANQHGGAALDAGPFPGAVTEQSMLPQNLQAAARVAPLNAALSAIANMKDPGQAGGARKGRKASKKAKKAKKTKKASRKASKKSRKQRGGAAYDSNPAPFGGPSMLLDSATMGKALSGMNAEWKLAENPSSFAPGYKS